MPTIRWLAFSALIVGSVSCAAEEGDAVATPAAGGQASVSDDVSMPNIVRVAVGSKDHTTLVVALQAADLVNSLANAGPFTVFAPMNSAFDALPKGTVDDLLKPANKPTLVNILYHHVATSALGVESLNEGTSLTMVDGTAEPITKRGNDLYIGGAKIVGSVRASNGWVHVVDKVLVPVAKP